MDNAQKTILRQNHRRLRDLISPSVEIICLDLISNSILSINMKDNILAEKTSSLQASELLFKLPSRGPLSFDVFYQICVDNGIHGAATILRPDIQIVSHSGEDFDTVEDIWLKEEHLDRVNDLDNQVIKDTEQTRKEFDKHIGQPGIYYQMTKEERGNLFIIREKGQQQQYHLDTYGLRRLFGILNFRALTVNVTKKEDLSSFLAKDCSPEDECVVLFIMSSNTDVLLSKKENIEIIVNEVKTMRCLERKPKLIFHIQRTAPFQNGAMAMEVNANENLVKDLCVNQPIPQGEFQEADDALNESDQDTVGGDDSLIPRGSDIYYIKSTKYGSETLGPDGDEFTRIVYLLITYISKYAHRHSFYELMRMINNEAGPDHSVARFVSDTSAPELYFFPGCYQ